MTRPKHQQGFYKLWIHFCEHRAFMSKLSWYERGLYQDLLWRAAAGEPLPADPADLALFLGGTPMPTVGEVTMLIGLIRSELRPHPTDPSLIQFIYIEEQREAALAKARNMARPQRRSTDLKLVTAGRNCDPRGATVPVREPHAIEQESGRNCDPRGTAETLGAQRISSGFPLEGVAPNSPNSSPILAPIAPKEFDDE